MNSRWNLKKINTLFDTPLMSLIAKAHRIHKRNFKVDKIELCTLLSIKTGGCPEDCAYCPQSAHYPVTLSREKLLSIDSILEKAVLAKKNGATRFCLGAAWRSPPNKHIPQLLEIISRVKTLGLEVCMTLGMLTSTQALQLKAAGLDFYNHNLDTSSEFYKKIISTRTYEDRLKTLAYVRAAGIKLCCGGILGMGETRGDRVMFLWQLANLDPYPESVPLNQLVRIKGTPLEHQAPIDNFEFLRTIAVARILMPKAKIRLSAGREQMTDEMQLLCFIAGINSIHFGEKLLVTKNPELNQDLDLLRRLNLHADQPTQNKKCAN